MTQHYFSERPADEMRSRTIEVSLGGALREVATASGVFSPDQLDRGTAILLRALADDPPQAPAGPLLDIGCGWGPIALDAALREPDREVWAIDVNERSRALTTENARALGLGNLRVSAPEDVPADLTFTQIRSNPPIRVGKAALHDILGTWLPRLAPGGIASLVVAKHLGADSLQRWIAAEFPDLAVARTTRDKGFHVIAVRA